MDEQKSLDIHFFIFTSAFMLLIELVNISAALSLFFLAVKYSNVICVALTILGIAIILNSILNYVFLVVCIVFLFKKYEMTNQDSFQKAVDRYNLKIFNSNDSFSSNEN